MRSSPGITIDRAIRGLRLSLWLGAGIDLAVAALLVLAPTAGARLPHLDAHPFYSEAMAVLLATVAAMSFVAAYAPYGNRRQLRVLAIYRLALGVVLWSWHLEQATETILFGGMLQLMLGTALLLCLWKARL